jgi:hypothetical protein
VVKETLFFWWFGQEEGRRSIRRLLFSGGAPFADNQKNQFFSFCKLCISLLFVWARTRRDWVHMGASRKRRGSLENSSMGAGRERQTISKRRALGKKAAAAACSGGVQARKTKTKQKT